MSRTLELVAVGARTPVGLTAEASAAAVRAGISRLSAYPFATADGECVSVAYDTEAKVEERAPARAVRMLDSVVTELLGKLDPQRMKGLECEAFLAIPEPRPGFCPTEGVGPDPSVWLKHELSQRLRGAGFQVTVHVIERGHAGVFVGLQRALHSAHDGLTLVLGVDSYIDPETFLWLEQEGRFAQPGLRGGFVPGEAAGGIALVSPSLRRTLQLPSLASLHGVGVATESQLRDHEVGSLGVATTAAVRQAGAGLQLPQDAAAEVFCDLNGERYRSEDWGFFALRAAAFMRTPQYVAPVDVWGDVGAASGALGAVLSAQAFSRGYASGPVSLLMGASDFGTRGAAFLRVPKGP